MSRRGGQLSTPTTIYLKISISSFTSAMTSSNLVGQICSRVSSTEWAMLRTPVELMGIAGMPRNENVEWLLSGHGSTQTTPGNLAATDLIFVSSSDGQVTAVTLFVPSAAPAPSMLMQAR